MTPANAITTCPIRYPSLKGRASRAEFRGFGLCFLAGAFATFWVTDKVTNRRGLMAMRAMLVYLSVFIIPFVTVAWRRFHDLGWPGVIALVPFVVLFVGITISIIETNLHPGQYAGLSGVIFGFGGFLVFGIPLLIWLALPSQPGPISCDTPPNEARR